ncbi:HipA domain-containing protein [Alteromonas australica]|uniref:HipA domain-containing protein n=1 Tax=Alteromonas australica TaxID=589873 RepID=UPI0035C7CC87
MTNPKLRQEIIDGQALANKPYTFDVCAEKLKVGVLTFSSSTECSFSYDEYWIRCGFDISPYIRIDGGIEDSDVNRFIRNLLPEGTGLRCLINTFNVSRLSILEILNHVQVESAGILHFEAREIHSVPSRQLTKQMLCRRLDTFSNVVIWGNQFRLNVAGVQKKLNVHQKSDGSFWLANKEFPSTHIIKFAEEEHSTIILNELLCMRLAKAIGLEVATVELLRVFDLHGKAKHCAISIERFDREALSKGTVHKRHIIDACQALNLPPEHKYEQIFGRHPDVAHCRDGASLKVLFAFARQQNFSHQNVIQILSWVVFNLIVGNSDAHGKNISFFIDTTGISLAPFYDILSIVFEARRIKNLDTDLAMAIGDEFDSGSITAFHLLSFSEEVEVTPMQLKTVVEEVALNCKRFATPVLCTDESMSKAELENLAQLILLINERADHFLRQTTLFDEVQKALL